jgi:hypothetical protein
MRAVQLQCLVYRVEQLRRTWVCVLFKPVMFTYVVLVIWVVVVPVSTLNNSTWLRN